MKRRIFSVILALCLCVALLPVAAMAADNSPTRDEAIKWLYNQEGVWHDLDNAHGAQCSDFVSAYMNWLYSGDTNPYQGYGVYYASYYPTVAGWNTGRWAVYSNTSSFVPEPGDIYVQSAHVGVFLTGSKSRATVIDQNSWETWPLAEENADIGRAGRIYDTSISDATYFIRYKNFSTAVATPTVTFTSWDNSNYTYIHETDASIGQQIDVSNGTCTKTGMILYNNSRKELGCAENPSYTEHRVFFKVSEELGVTLSPGTTYQYRFWAAVNGKIYYSDYKSFKTSGTATIAVTGISVNRNSLSLKTGESTTLTATVSPSNATDKTVTWSSSNTKVATVSGGKVTAVAAGTATITAKAGNKSATCTVTVSNATVEVTGISLNKTSLSLTTGGNATLTAAISPSNATDKTVTWSSSNTKIATVSGGKVTAVAAGTATITAKAGNKSATCTVTVSNATVAVTGLRLNKISLTLTPGATETLTATVMPSNATDQTVTWSSNDTSVVTVDKNGKVTAIAAGSAKITAEAGGKTVTCTVTVAAVTVAVTSISLNKTALTLNSGETATLTATISPNNATDKNIVWTSDNEAVATVYNGVVTAVSAGTTIIRAQAGGKSASCNITVTGEAKECSFEIGAYVDGNYEVNFGYYGVVDVYMNGELVAPSVGMYLANLPAGTTYEIKNIVNNRNGYKYDGVYDGSLKGTISGDNVKVTLKFVKDAVASSNKEPTVEGEVSVVQANGLKLENLTYTYTAGGREAEANPGVVGSFSVSYTVSGEENVCKARSYAPQSSFPTENEIDTLASQQAAKGKLESGFNTANANGKPPFPGGAAKPVTADDLDTTRYVVVLGFDKNTDVVGYAVLKIVVGVSSDKVFSGAVQPTTTESPSAWAQKEVSTAIDVGLVPINLQQNYTKPVSRADVAQMFINLIEQSSGKSVDSLMNEKGVSINKDAFTDTSDYAVLAANALGIINGTGNSQFSPNGTFTRSQIAAIINRVARVLGVDTDGYTHSFTDVVGHWVDTELGWPSGVGIINGVGNNQFSPDTYLTTEQSIAITYRALQILEK